MKLGNTFFQSLAWLLMVASLIAMDAAHADDGFQFVSMWGNKGDGPGEFVGPFDVTVDRDGYRQSPYPKIFT